MQKLQRMLEKFRRMLVHEEGGYWVRGSSPIYVPKARLHEIPMVVKEHHKREAELDRVRTMIIRIV